ncbi:MAG: AAA family ATPase [Coriobacteriia bacterium]|nr:AAA family ATPase [Coriobacteriia bacterium]
MTVAAYAFAPPRLAPVELYTPEGIKGAEHFQVFKTGWDCREALACASSTVQVVVSEEVVDVAPLNLVAALHDDEPQRDVYLVAQQPSASLFSRVLAAGGRGIIDQKQMEAMVKLRLPAGTENEAPTPTPTPVLPQDSSHVPLTPQVTVSAPYSLQDVSLVAASFGGVSSTPEFWQDRIPELQAVANSSATTAAPSPVKQTVAPVSPARQNTYTKTPHIQIPTLPQPEIVFNASSKEGCAVAFVSGRGGVGKSTLSLLTALLLYKRGLKTVLIDLDLQFGDLAYCVGQVPQSALQCMSIETALNGPERPQPSSERLCLIEAPSRPEQAEEYVEEISGLIRSLKTVADYVVVNTGSFWSELQAILAQSVDHLVFVMDQRATSIRGCKQVVDLCVRLQIPSVRFSFLLNRCARHAPFTALDVSMALGGSEVFTIADGGPIVDEMLSLGCPHELLESDAALRSSFDQLLKSLKAVRQPAPNRPAPALGAFSSILKGRRRGVRHVRS